MSYTAAQLIELLHLLPHPEGGWYAFRESSGQVLPALLGFPGHRESCSYIYYLLQRGEISRWHQLKATEVWTWHQGGSLEMTLGGTGTLPVPESTLTLGPRLEAGEQFQRMTPANCWPRGGRGLRFGILRSLTGFPGRGLPASLGAFRQ